MSCEEIDALTNCLSAAAVDDKLVSFALQGLVLNSEDDAKEVVDAIQECEGMEVLELRGNTLGIEACKAIGKALEKRPGFKRALWSDIFTGRMKSEIPPALINLCGGLTVANAQLLELDLSDNAFGPNGMSGITEFLASPCCYSLKTLKLNNNGLGTTGGKMLFESLKKCFESSSEKGQPLALKKFVSGRGRLENDGAILLAELFKMMKSLEEVYMSQNGINHEGIAALADAFTENKNLRVIDLSDNTFIEEGTMAMAKALKTLDKLEVLNFDDCLLKELDSFAETLKEGHIQLKILTLSGNEITSEGGLVLANSVKDKPHFENLNLNCNELGQKGIQEVKEIFADRPWILTSLSDDEGDKSDDGESSTEHVEDGDSSEGLDSDDDDDGDDDDEEAIKVSSSDDEEETIKLPSSDKVESKGESTEPIKKSMTPLEDLLESPTKQKLLNLLKNDSSALPEHIESLLMKSRGAVLALMKLAEVCSEKDKDTNKIIFDYMNNVGQKLNAKDFRDEILESIGLIKSEDTKVTQLTEGQLILLEHVAKNHLLDHDPGLLKHFMETFGHRIGDEEMRKKVQHILCDPIYNNCLIDFSKIKF